MVSISVAVAVLADLRPGIRSLTTGEPGGELVTVRPLRPSLIPLPLTGPITLRLDPVSARRFRLYRRLMWIVPAIGLLTFAAMFWAVSAKGYVWVWALLGTSLAASLLDRALYPAAFPRFNADKTMVRLDRLDPDAVREWIGVNGSAGITVLPEAAAGPWKRRYFFGTKEMFFAMVGYCFLCAMVIANVFEGGIRAVPVEREVFSWGSGDREEVKSLAVAAGGILSIECSGGGQLRLISISPRGEQEQFAKVSCDGSRNPVSYPAGQPMFEVLAREFSGTVTAWKVSVTRSEVQKQTLPAHAPVWTVVFPIGLTALLALVPLEALLMVRRWRAIPPQLRPYEIGALPEFSGFSALTMAICLVGLLAASFLAVQVWLMWARAS